jgi:hypothetical protein
MPIINLKSKIFLKEIFMRSTIKTPLILTFISVFMVVLLYTIVFFTKNTEIPDESGYYMKSLNNTVVLYKNDVIVKVYDGIVLDTLPIADRDLLDRGIHYKTLADADTAAEDYDG